MCHFRVNRHAWGGWEHPETVAVYMHPTRLVYSDQVQAAWSCSGIKLQSEMVITV